MRKKWLAFTMAAVLCMGSAVTVCAEETDNAAQTASETEQGSDTVQNADAEGQAEDTNQNPVVEGQTDEAVQDVGIEGQADDTTQDANAGEQADGVEESTDYPTATLTLVWHFGEWGKTPEGYYDTGSYTEAGSLVMETKTITLDQQDENGNYYYEGQAIRFDREEDVQSPDTFAPYIPFYKPYFVYNGVEYDTSFLDTHIEGMEDLIDDKAIEYTDAKGNMQILRGIAPMSINLVNDDVYGAWCDTNSGVVYCRFNYFGEGREAGWSVKTYGDAVCHVYYTKVISSTNDGDSNADTPADSENSSNVYGGTGIVRGASINFPIGEVDETTLTDAQKASVQKYGEAMKELTGVEASNCKIIDLIDIRKPDGVTDEELAEGIDITFPVRWIASSDKIIVLHLKSDGVWELIPATAGDGKITARFTSLSPVVIAKVSEETAANGTEQGTHVHSYYEQVVAPTADTWGYTMHTCECGDSYADNYVAPFSQGAGDAAVSPKTGETGVPYAVACVMLAAIGVVTITVGRKARTGQR